MKLGIRTKLFLISFGLIVLTVLVGYAYIARELEAALVEDMRADLGVRARLIADQAERYDARLDDLAAWDELADEIGATGEGRVTFMRKDGTVIGDSQVPHAELPNLENHADRSEIRQALAGRLGRSERRSTSVDMNLLYVAVPFSRDGQLGGVARLAVTTARVDANLAELRHTVLLAALLALGFALVISTLAAHAASRPARSLTEAARRMAGGDLATRTQLKGTDEFAQLGRALDRVARNLSATLEELRGERDRLSAILSGMQEGVLMLDRQGKVAVINPALREMLLLGPDALGKTPLELIRHAELEELLDEARSSERRGVSGEIELGGLKPRRLFVRAAPLSGELGMFAVFVDVTEMRRLETMRRDFVANVSHELRTPVTAIRSAAETLSGLDGKDPAAGRLFIDIIERNAARLHELVEDVLDLSRIESRAFKLALEPLEVEDVMVQIASLFADSARKKNIRLTLAAGRGLPPARADRRALEHVLANLVDNAVKYCGTDCEIGLSVELEGGGDGLRVSVSDDGPGIDAQHLPRLFERFYRVDAGRSRELGGTGLGLSIVKHLVEAMGSTIGVESRPGRGTTFSFVLRPWRSDQSAETERAALH